MPFSFCMVVQEIERKRESTKADDSERARTLNNPLIRDSIPGATNANLAIADGPSESYLQ